MLLNELTTRYLHDHPLEAARILERNAPETMAALFSGLEPDIAAQAARYVSVPHLTATINYLDAQAAGRLYMALPLDVQLVVWHSAKSDLKNVLSAEIPKKHLKLIKKLASFPAGSAASMMDPVVFSVPHDIRAEEALKLANHHPDALRFYVYVVDREQHLAGVLTLRQLMQAPAKEPISKLAENNISKIHATASKTDVLEHPDWQHFHSLPVVDDENVLIGVIRYKTWRRETVRASDRAGGPIWDTVLALSELYWQGMSETVLGGRAEPIKPQENHHGGS